MNSGNADIVKTLYLVAHQFGRDHCLFRNRDVAGASTDHGDAALPVNGRIQVKDDGPRLSTVLRVTNFLFDGLKLIRNHSCSQNIVAVFREAEEDFGNLSSALALGKDHFGYAHTQSTMMVHFGEAEIFKRQVGQLA